MIIFEIIKEVFLLLKSFIEEFFIRRHKKFNRIAYTIPKKTVIIGPYTSERPSWWHMGSVNEKPAMQITVDGYLATNITKYNILLTVAILQRSKTLGSISTRDTEGIYWGKYGLPPGESRLINIDFWVIPPFIKESESFNSDVIVLDQFRNKHKIKKVRFIYK